MQKHPLDVRVQRSGIKGLASAMKWPAQIRHASSFCPEQALALTKQAMQLHIGELDLQHVALERLETYYCPFHPDAILRCGGYELIKTVLMTHCSDDAVQSTCHRLLHALGAPIPNVSFV